MSLSNKIEAILFFKSEPVSIGYLAGVLEVDPSDIERGLSELATALEGRGIRLLYYDGEVALGTAPELSSLVESIIKDELSKDIGKAGLETLAIVLYRGPVTRSEIDYIRGVNSTFVLRNLMVRGLVERVPHESDGRTFLYKPTFELLSYLGIVRVEELPEYNTVRAELESLRDGENVEESECNKEGKGGVHDFHKDDEGGNNIKRDDTPSSMKDSDDSTRTL